MTKEIDFVLKIPEILQPIVTSFETRLQAALESMPLELQAKQNELAHMWSEWRYVVAISDFVGEYTIRHANDLWALFEKTRTIMTLDILEHALHLQLQSVTTEEELLRSLRQFRNQEMVRIIWRDLIYYPQTRITLQDLTTLAEVCISKTLNWLHQQQAQLAQIAPDQIPQLLVLALGKLGAQELNLSSDIDLIFAYPEQALIAHLPPSFDAALFYEQIAKRLVKALHIVTVDGFVFRVDLRLRPYGDSGPLVMNVQAMQLYYQEQGREWERFALTKARLICGNHPGLVNLLRAFIYRRYVDYGIIHALRQLKQLIVREAARFDMANNIKLGEGGIREIEFIVQVFQIARGGREPFLQQPSVLQLLPKMHHAKLLPENTIADLTAAYLFLRQVEHVLQAINDQQNQQLPSNNVMKARLCFALQQSTERALFDKIKHHRTLVATHFADIIAPTPMEQTSIMSSWCKEFIFCWQQSLSTDSLHKLLHQISWPDLNLTVTVNSLLVFRQSRRYQHLSQIAQQRIEQIMPQILLAAVKQDNPSEVLERLLHILNAILTRSAYISLLLEHPPALAHVVAICTRSLWLAEQLALYPLLLDEMLTPIDTPATLSCSELAQELRQLLLAVPEDNLDAQMESLRSFKHAKVLQVLLAEQQSVLTFSQVTLQLTRIAEVMIRQVLGLVWQQVTARFGYPAGIDRTDVPPLLVVAYGKLGGKELGITSDLDVIFLYPSKNPAQLTIGPEPIAEEALFLRVAQRMLHLLQTQTDMGRLYTLDTRLRPDGNSGLLVSSLNRYRDYQRNKAWTFEHQALVRARAITGPKALIQEFQQIRQEILCMKRDKTALQNDILAMQEKLSTMHQTKHLQFNIKNGPGGLMDLDFIVQYLVLLHANTYPALANHTQTKRLLVLIAEYQLLPEAEIKTLQQIHQTYASTLQELALQNLSPVVQNTEFVELRAAVLAISRAVFEKKE